MHITIENTQSHVHKITNVHVYYIFLWS